jgi:glucosamine-6-phosphate deaminase
MHLQRLPDSEAVAQAAADLVAEELHRRPDAGLILPAGSTPVPLFRELIRRSHSGHLDLSSASFFQLDEYLGVGVGDEKGFSAFLHRELFNPLGIAREHCFLIDGRASDPEAELRQHAAELTARGGADLALLGLGANGHIAFNEPGSARHSPARRVQLAAETLQAQPQHTGSAAATEGLTLGIADILQSRRLVLLVTGTSKASALARVMAGPADASCPASWLSEHPAAVILADPAAASQVLQQT